MEIIDSKPFETADLYSERNLEKVLEGIHTLARHLESQEGYDGPLFDHSFPPLPLAEGTLTSSQKDMMQWVNDQFAHAGNDLKVTRFRNDFRDGVFLIKLLQVDVLDFL